MQGRCMFLRLAPLVAPNQEQSHFSGELSLALECKNKEAAADARGSWRMRAQGFLRKRLAQDAAVKEQRPAKRHRTKARAWVTTLNNIVLSTRGRTLNWFRQDPDTTMRSKEVQDWPYLGICPDQGSDGMAAAFFLKYHAHLNCEVWHDPSHGTWRDQEQAVRGVGLQGFCYLVCVLLNLQHGPWESQARYRQLSEAGAEYLEHLAPECPLLRSFAPSLVREYDLSEHEQDDDILARIIDCMKTDFNMQYKGTQVKMCRFANWVDRSSEFLGSYSAFLLRLLYVGLTEGHFTNDSLHEVLDKISVPQPAGDSHERMSIERGQDAMRSFRGLVKNNVRLAATLMLQPMTARRVKVLTHLVSEIRLWYGKQSKGLRPTTAHSEWIQSQVAGAIFEPLQATAAMLSSRRALDAIDMRLDLLIEELQWAPEHPAVAEEDEVASLAGEYVRRSLFVPGGLRHRVWK